MADKIDKDESISRVYQFLSKQQDWKADADKNGDGHIVKTEFRAYILSSNFKFNNGEDKEDLINTFWKSIDTNTSGKIGGSKISNKNALDKAEEKKIEDNIKATEMIMQFAKQMEFPADILNSKYKSQWKESVKAGLLNQAMEFLKTHSIEELTEEKLQEFYAKSSIKAIADYKALDEIEKNITSKYGNIGYKVGSDEVLNGIINEYIQNLKGTEDKNQVVKDIEDIVKAYVSLTVDGQDEGAISILSNYKFFDEDEINPLQEAVLTTRLKSEIVKELQASKAEVYNVYQSTIDPKIDEYVKTVINGEDDYNTVMKNIASLASEFMSQIADIEKEYKDLQTQIQNARSELNTYIGQILAEGKPKKTAIVQEIFGTTDAKQIMEELLKLNTVEDINAKKTELETRIEEYEAQKSTVVDQSDELKKQNIVSGIDAPAFYVSSDGSIVFVNYNAEHGVFNDKPNTILNNKFSTLKSKLEKAYADNIESSGLTSTELKNLFNAALYMALSDETVLRSQYETADLSAIADAVIDNYTAMLKKVVTDENAREYIKNYSGKSIIAGRSVRSSGYERSNWGSDSSGLTRNMDKYYSDDSTASDDDWVSVNNTTTHTTNFGDIIYLSSNSENDNNAANAAMESLFYDYLNSYGKVVDKSTLTSLYRQAQEVAISKLKSLTDCTNPAGSSVYGYGECFNGESDSQYDTKSSNGAGNGFISVPALLIEIMYEMERLVGLQVMGLS